MNAVVEEELEFTALFPFCGLGAGARGFLDASVRMLGRRIRFRSLGGIDFEKRSCEDFAMLTGSPALQADIHDLTREQLLAFCPTAPDVIFSSPPCKGFSSLMNSETAKQEKYQRMNRLVLRWLELVLDAWSGQLPKLILIENVPQIASRGKDLIKKVKALLKTAGYVFNAGFHECGELGGLAQIRRRFLLVARLSKDLPPLLYQPPKKRVRAVGEVLSQLPMPNDPAAGPMHVMPKISWLNWVRLALIPAGGDWRDIPGVLEEGQERRAVFRRHMVVDWDKVGPTVAGPGSNGPQNVSDPRPKRFAHVDEVTAWDKPSGTVTSSPAPSSGAESVADPRTDWFNGTMGVKGWDEPSGTITGNARPSTGPFSVADNRIAIGRTNEENRHWNKYRIERWDKPAHTVIGATRPGSGSMNVADVRVGKSFDHGYAVLHWRKEASPTVAGGSHPGQGAYSVGDPRLNDAPRAGAYGVISLEDAAKTVTGTADTGGGCWIVQDPRSPDEPVAFIENVKKDPGFVPVILSEDGTWHRPMTTLELAVLQGLPWIWKDKPLELSGTNVSGWRERIGNAVPVQTAQAIAEQMLVTLTHGTLNSFVLSGSNPVWVRQEEEEFQGAFMSM